MARSPSKAGPTHYQILQVHPAAPLDLITAAYWRLVGQAQTAAPDKVSEVAVYHLTRSYQVLADPHSRSEYDRFLGIPLDQLPPRVPVRRKPSWVSALWQSDSVSSAADDPGVDYYELLRLDPLANPAIIQEAYSSMRNCYLRLVELGKVTPGLVELLDEAYEVISDPDRRRQYDKARKRARPLPSTNGSRAQKSENERETPTKPQAHGGTDSHGPRSGSRSAREGDRSRASEKLRSSKASNRKDQLPTKQGNKAPSSGRASANKSARRNATTRAKTPEPLPERPMSDNGRSPWESPEGEGADPGATLRAVGSLVSTSAGALLKGGKKSIGVLRKASDMLRNILLDVEPQTQDGLSPEEEEALLDRLSQMPDGAAVSHTPPMEVHPRAIRAGPLARLTLISGPGLGREFEIEAVPFTIGEDAGCDVALPGLALQQARLLHQNGHFILYSLSDQPGTSIHGESVTWAVLQHGDAFEIGPYQMRFESISVPLPQS